jgi:hypothetical protein
MNAKRNILALFVIVLILQFCMALPVMSAAKYADSTSFNPVPIAVEAKGAGGVPVGTIISWPSAANPEDPDNWLECNGQGFSPAVYPELSSALGGAAAVPDFRGLFLRGVGNVDNAHKSAAIGTVQKDAVYIAPSAYNAQHTLYGVQKYKVPSSSGFCIYTSQDENGMNSSLQPCDYIDALGVGEATVWSPWGNSDHHTYYSATGTTTIQSGLSSTTGVTENTPINTAVRYLIRALP